METRIQGIIKNNNINIDLFSDLLGAVIIADKTFGNNRQESDIDRFVAQYPNFGYKLNDESKKSTIKPLPRVQVKRIFIDSLILALERQRIHINDLHLTMPSSKHIGIGKTVTGVQDYSDEAECDRLLDIIENNSIDNQSECDELFSYISDKLKVISNSKFYFMFKDYDFSKVYLPKEYESYGFNVSTEMPNNLKSIIKADMVKCFENNFAVQFCSAFINGIYQTNLRGKVTDNILRLKALSYLDDMVNKGNNYLPIGIDTVSSKIETAFVPRHKNNDDFSLFSKVFKVDIKSNRSDVEKIICMLDIL